MKVAFISSLNGGVGRHTLELTRELSRHVESIHLYLYADRQRSIPIVDLPNNVSMVMQETRPVVLLIRLLFSLGALRKYDIVHLNAIATFSLPLYLMAKLWGTPYVFTAHGFPIVSTRKFPESLYVAAEAILHKFAAANSRRYVTITNEVRDRFRDRYGIEPSVIYHGVDPRRFKFDQKARQEIRSALELEESQSLLLFIGVLYRHKDVLTLIDALPKVIERNHQVKLLVIGRGDQYDVMLKRIGELGLGDYVFVKPWVEATEPYYSAADVFVMPSRKEEFGFVYVEAMACGLPIIAANATVVPEVVGDAGLLFQPGNSDELSNGILELLGDRELSAALREKGLERAKQFTWEKAASRYLEIYEEALERGKRRHE